MSDQTGVAAADAVRIDQLGVAQGYRQQGDQRGEKMAVGVIQA